ncbi:MAG: sugar phosphate isomerase/epimerase [Candidatus Heimdallarchaeota archaeon]|nr:sugar phosphate isomerase/epimerase [Candidatus Heimdallarchaeota archaeon]MCK5049211.1 sugar phosphate isomerase/epimerase [Candidatus Heimdallarchaeota archaeon]
MLKHFKEKKQFQIVIGVSLRASWELNRPASDFLSLFEVDFFELQLDNPLFLFEKNRAKAIEFIDKLAVHKPLSFHLSYINVNPASFNEKMRKATSMILQEQLSFISRWSPVYAVFHTGDRFPVYLKDSLLQVAQEQQKKTIEEVLEVANNYSITLAMENYPKWFSEGLVTNYEEMKSLQEIYNELNFLIDLGHLNTITKGPNEFVEELGKILDLPVIAFHLSNNFGEIDSHEPLTNGTVPLAEIFNTYTMIKEKYLALENKTIEDTLESLEILNRLIT